MLMDTYVWKDIFKDEVYKILYTFYQPSFVNQINLTFTISFEDR